MSQDDELPADTGVDEPRDRPLTPDGVSKPAAKKPRPATATAAAAKAVPNKAVPSKTAPNKAATAAVRPRKAAADRAAPAAVRPRKATPKAAARKEVGEAPFGPEPQVETSDVAPSAVSNASARPTGLKLLMHVARPRASRGQVVVALLCGLLGFALVTQVHSEAGVGLSSARQSDLVDVLDNLSAKSEQLRTQISDEQNTLSKLTGGTDQTQAALQEAQQRATTLRILAGTVGASGPGIDLHITDPDHKITADVMLNTLEELRDAGAEAVEIRGGTSATVSPSNQSLPSGAALPSSQNASGPPAAGAQTSSAVRLVANSYFVDSQDGQGIVADDTLLLPPYDLLAIGDPPTLGQAMGIPGGVLDSLKSRGAHGTVTKLDTVRITALHALTPPKYARPAASP